MKAYFYSLLITGSLLTMAPVLAATPPHTFTENPAEIQRKTMARAKATEAKKATTVTAKRSIWYKTRKVSSKMRRTMLVILGLAESKAVTSPAKLSRQLHAHQQQLKIRAFFNARARRARTGR